MMMFLSKAQPGSFHKCPAFSQYFLLLSREQVEGSRGSGRKGNAKDLEIEEGFSTGYNFSGSQLTSHLGSTNDLKYKSLFHIHLNTFLMMGHCAFSGNI